MKSLFFVAILSFLTFQDNLEVSEEVKYQMYLNGLNNWSTSPNFIVINVKNLNTGEIKELCTEAPFLRGALRYRDDCTRQKIKANFKVPKELKKNTARYFQFRCDSSLYNIGFNSYTPKELKRFQDTINLDSIISLINKAEIDFSGYKRNKRANKMLAHLLFNRGYEVRRGDRFPRLFCSKFSE